MVQGQEPRHFIKMFGGSLVVFSGERIICLILPFFGAIFKPTEYTIFLISANDAQHTLKNVKLTLSIR